MEIEILRVGEPFKDGKLVKLQLDYAQDGKPSTRKLVALPHTLKAFEVLKEGKPGEMYDVTLVKDEKSGFNNWTAAAKMSAAQLGGAAPEAAKQASGTYQKTSTTNTYETPIERAYRQRCINRLASLGHSINYMQPAGASMDEILSMADIIVDWVIGERVEPLKSDSLDSIQVK